MYVWTLNSSHSFPFTTKIAATAKMTVNRNLQNKQTTKPRRIFLGLGSAGLVMHHIFQMWLCQPISKPLPFQSGTDCCNPSHEWGSGATSGGSLLRSHQCPDRYPGPPFISWPASVQPAGNYVLLTLSFGGNDQNWGVQFFRLFSDYMPRA